MERVITFRDAWELYNLHPYITAALVKTGKVRAIRYRGMVLVCDEDVREWGKKLDVRQFEHLRGKPIKAYHVEKKYGIPHHTLTGWVRSGKITTIGNHHWNVMVDEAEAAFAAHFLKLLGLGMRGKWHLPKPNLSVVFDGNDKMVTEVLWQSIQGLGNYKYKLKKYTSPSDADEYADLCWDVLKPAIQKGSIKTLKFRDSVLVLEASFKRLVAQVYKMWFEELDGQVIQLTKAARKYNIALSTIQAWIRKGWIMPVKQQGNQIWLPERAVAQAVVWNRLFSLKKYYVARYTHIH